MIAKMFSASISARTIFRAWLFVSISVAALCAQTTERMTPGQWELTTTTKGESQV
jgi:hypothetical protein